MINKGKINASEIRICYAGNHSNTFRTAIANAGLEEIFIDYGLVSRQSSIELQRQSHINLLLSWSKENNSGILTGKFYEYLSAQKTILALITGNRDREFEKLFNDLNAGILFYNKKESAHSLKEFLIKKITAWQSGEPNLQAINNELFKEFLWEYTAPRFLEFLSKLKYHN